MSKGKSFMYRYLGLAFALALGGCTSNTVSNLHYTPTVSVQAASSATIDTDPEIAEKSRNL